MMTSIEATQALQSLAQRNDLDLDQLAGYLCVPYATARNWMKGEKPIDSAGRRLVEILLMLETLAPAIHAALIPPKGAPFGRPVRVKG